MKKLSSFILFFGFITSTKAQKIYTCAGNGTGGYSGNGGMAIQAQIAGPMGVAVDASGNIYIADHFNHAIRKVNTSGIITTVAGTGVSGYSGDGGPATLAQIYLPMDIAFDASGNLYISDAGNSRIRMINTSGTITTIAGTGTVGFSGDGGLATLAQIGFGGAGGITVDGLGNIYFSDQNNFRIRKINTSGIITTIAGTGVSGYSGDGGQAVSAQLGSPYGITIDPVGIIYFVDGSGIRKINSLGIISTIAGCGFPTFCCDGGVATSACINSPYGLQVDASSNLYIADRYNDRIRKIDNSGIITTIAGNGITGYSGDGGLANAAQIYWPWDITIDALGNIYVADEGNHRIRIICSTNCPIGTTINSNAKTAEEIIPYPNPVINKLFLNKSPNQMEDLDVEVINQLSQSVLKSKYMNEIDVSALPQGLYILKITGQNHKTTLSKFIKE